ncbi:16S rRNA (uracil(1498)-N(3))-methyltransferase [Alkalimarinus alittae]|uniref:Ribosomal RNA small subunit methyltransferase E n=1 Tax=Alkalimarinus alittae TaxID=2961619 RepID=A0ABY6N083_9ALTE|nr:16S rRNA (uracil(1498)-N(3))-methyltransferase [Alkalimarinus alittae]UZE95432.1 16S rRNA (uracil(1498)-N(3))-methyltransferase [Alkalimarinus alittae]
MRIPRIYTATELTEGTTIELDSAAANHVGKVLRMKPDQSLILFNGSGNDYTASISDVTKKHVTVVIDSTIKVASESPLETHIGQVMSRGDRMDYMIQKSTELGATEITPLTSERCEVKLKGDREEKRVKQWQQIAISAAEQCGRSKIPIINPVTSLDEWVSSKPDDTLGLVLHHRTTQQITDIKQPEKVCLLIGPEGGLSKSEIDMAINQQFVATTFGPRVFRTETAPVAALSIIQWLWGDFNR